MFEDSEKPFSVTPGETMLFLHQMRGGVIFDADVAVKIGELLCKAHYGKGELERQKPLSAVDKSTYWRVEGSWNRLLDLGTQHLPVFRSGWMTYFSAPYARRISPPHAVSSRKCRAVASDGCDRRAIQRHQPRARRRGRRDPSRACADPTGLVSGNGKFVYCKPIS